jgi:hypothetical protein
MMASMANVDMEMTRSVCSSSPSISFRERYYIKSYSCSNHTMCVFDLPVYSWVCDVR